MQKKSLKWRYCVKKYLFKCGFNNFICSVSKITLYLQTTHFKSGDFCSPPPQRNAFSEYF